MIDSTHSQMAMAHRIWVFFLLACGLGSARADFVPVASEIQLPEFVRGRPVWVAKALPEGELVVCVKGAVLIGTPNRTWRVLTPPDGPTAHLVSPAHDRIFLASTAYASLIESDVLRPVNGIVGRVLTVEAVPEGWLCGGDGGITLVSPDGAATNLLRPTGNAKGISVIKCSSGVYAIDGLNRPKIWKNGILAEQDTPATESSNHVFHFTGGLWLTSRGVLNEQGKQLLNSEVRRSLFGSGKAMGVISSDQIIYFGTYGDGLIGYRIGDEQPSIHWNDLGGFYHLQPAGKHWFAGTSKGLFAFANPNQVVMTPLNGVDFLTLHATHDGVFVINFGPAKQVVGTPTIDPQESFPGPAGTKAVGSYIRYKKQSVYVRDMRSQCFGISVIDDTAAFGLRDSVELLDGNNHISINLKQDFTRLETDGKYFYASTTAHGVHVIDVAGKIQKTIGSGWATLRKLENGKILLIFSSGEIRDTAGDVVLRTIDSIPLDVVLLNGKLVVLLAQTNSAPVLAEYDNGKWRPLEVLGLASISAESVVTFQNKLYIAGRRGVMDVRLPLSGSATPEPQYRWSAPVAGDRVLLPSETHSIAKLSPGKWEPELEPATLIRFKINSQPWANARPGADVSIPVGWGENAVTIVAERNMLRSERTFTVVRPFPWWMRPWAWPIHVSSVALLVWLGIRWRTRQLEERARELETRVGERTTALVRANASKEEFLAMVGHEVRNPLNGLVGIALILQDTEIGPREKNFLRVLAGCADQLRSIMDDVMDYSRSERGQLVITQGTFDLVTLVEQCAHVMDPTLGSCSLILPERPAWFVGDSGKIRQILCNLVGNALKYGQPREAGIELKIIPVQPGHSLIRVSVRNTGPTIPAAELPHLFEPFRRGSNTSEIKGSGLGLTVSRRLATAMNGKLNATSANSATEFVFEVTLPQSHEPPKIPVFEKPVSRALAIEDEDYNRLVLGYVLRELGYEVDWAPDGASALRLAARQTYDLIITDWQLPDLAGDELCRRLQKVLGEPRPPIIAVTAYTAGEKFDAARAAGMAGFLTKPVTRDRLEHLLRRLAEGLNPRAPVDVPPPPPPSSPTLAQLGDLGPSIERLASEIITRWAEAKAQAELKDPRASRTAHALRSLLLLAGEEDVAEQVGLLETNAAENDWDTVNQLLPFLSEEIAAVRGRMKLS